MPDRAAERLIADRYALAVPIGQGGMGVVWRARDTLLGREVAIKEVRLPATIPDSERSSLRARVLREARAAARLNHPGAVTLYDVINEQGHAFIVMELINAPTLAQVVAKQGPLDPVPVARIGAQVAAALAAAHQAGIVHRDVKPANVMAVGDGARLTDFGIARVKGDPKLTSTGLIVGSPAYMAPEQASGAAAGPEADLWGLGATLYYAVEGRPPFERDGQIAVLTAVVNDQPRAPRRAGPLGPVIAALLSKDPERRPDAADLRGRLERLAGAGRDAIAAAAPGARAGQEPSHGEATEVAAEAAGDEPVAAAAGDTDQLPELDDVPAAAPPPPPGKPFELTRPGPSRPGHQGPAHVRPDQPTRPGRSGTGPPGHPAFGPAPDGTGPAPDGTGPADPDGLEDPLEIESPGEAARAAGNSQPPKAIPPGGTILPSGAARPGGTSGLDGAAGPAAAGPGGSGRPGGARRSAGATAARGLRSAGAMVARGLRTVIGPPGRRLDGGRLPLLLALLAVVALLAAAIATSNALRDSRRPAPPAGSRAAATTGPSGTTASSGAPSTSQAPGSSAPETSRQPAGTAVPRGWTPLRNADGAYMLAYPPDWRASRRSDGLNTTNVSGPGGQLFKVQSTSSPSDPMRAWTAQERSFSDRPGYRRIRLEPGRYKGLDAAVWEFTQLEGGRLVHKLDITFKSADGRWGYAVLLQAPEQAWSGTARLSGQFERAFAPIG
jgi:eukaryotic-like serine/threonine-protein kinase